MQDIHSIGSGGGGGARLFGGGSGGDRRLRPHHHHNHHHHHHHQGHTPQALKCPRCESLNTKFCYYNNYNLSQPRHFCKNCRRYWTKGGVLRNVPVGGGCRKTKRSKPKSSNNNPTPSSDAPVRKSSNSQNSSSDSSSLTANTTTNTKVKTVTTTTTTPVKAAEVLSGINFQESSSGFMNITQSSTPNPNLDPLIMNQGENNIFPEIGTFTSLIASSSGQLTQLPLGFNIADDISPFRLHHTGHIVENLNANQQQWMHTDHTMEDDLKVPEVGGGLGFMDAQTDQPEFSGMQKNASNGEIGTEDWDNGADQALFDLTGSVDQSYWSQTQWDEPDQHDDHGHNQLDYLP